MNNTTNTARPANTDEEGDCCPRCANPALVATFDALGVGHEDYCDNA